MMVVPVHQAMLFALISMAPIYPPSIRDAQGNIIYNQSARINEYDYGDGY